MREIKFRADDGMGWIYSSAVEYREEDDQWLIFDFEEDKWLYCTKPEQYTGLKDKNGREIYEGDILLFNNDHPNAKKMDWKCVVKYRKGSFVCEYPKDGVYNHFDSWNVPKVTWEVIGNIYENPELLEGEG